jgi:hypothetical protein
VRRTLSTKPPFDLKIWLNHKDSRVVLKLILGRFRNIVNKAVDKDYCQQSESRPTRELAGRDDRSAPVQRLVSNHPQNNLSCRKSCECGWANESGLRMLMN